MEGDDWEFDSEPYEESEGDQDLNEKWEVHVHKVSEVESVWGREDVECDEAQEE